MHLVNEQEHLYTVQIWDDIKNLILSELNIIERYRVNLHIIPILSFFIYDITIIDSMLFTFIPLFSQYVFLHWITSNQTQWNRGMVFLWLITGNIKICFSDNKIMHRCSNLQSLNIKTLILEFLMALIVIQILYY